MAPKYTNEPIAIVGSACKFPGASSNPSKLWSLLKEPRDLLREVPEDRFSAKGFYHVDGEHHGTTNVTQSYFLDEDPRVFDYNFFNINPREAESMDPQQRMLLETVYESLESAGYSLQQLKGSDTAVFVGQMTGDYYDVLARDIESVPHYIATGVSRAIMANRISYFFDWKGASLCVDTACSSSLVAVHQAVQELRSGHSKVAVAAGVNIILGPELYIYESKLHMLSPTGRSRMWDAGADGYARGEGIAAVMLKTLSQAIADGDHIECIIRETGVNQDGRTPGITMPSATSQTALIRSTYERAGLDLLKKEDRCQFFEAHGTGTLAGDPVEAEAVFNAFYPPEHAAADDDVLYVGSVKTVIGHLEGTAGLAGLLKASLAVQNGYIPPNMLFNKLNPKIEPFYSHLRVPTEAIPWPALPAGMPRRVSVNSFGFGGTNAHAIVESYAPDPEPAIDANLAAFGPFPLSANSPSSLIALVSALHDFLLSHPDISLSSLAYTLQSRRSPLPYRASFSGTNRTDLLSSLSTFLASDTPPVIESLPVPSRLPPRILGIFTGQGAQWATMGSALYSSSTLFRNVLSRLEFSLSTLPDGPTWSLAEELARPSSTSRIQDPELSQPLCTALQIALVDLLRASGVQFSGVLGHSSGEIAAAYTAGFLSAEDALRIAYYRGVHAKPSGTQRGAMMAVGMGLDEAMRLVGRDKWVGRVQVAASNSRSSTTLSGDMDAIEALKGVLDEQGVFARLLKVDVAYHSRHMLPCAGPYLESLKKCGIQVGKGDKKCEWFSSVYGPDGRSIFEPETYAGQYWVDNMVKPVLFSQALDRAVTESQVYDFVVEVGPHPALKGPATEGLKALTGLDLPFTGVLSRGKNDVDAFSDALGFLWSHFHTPTPVVDFEKLANAFLDDNAADARKRVLKGLPGYEWDHDTVLWKESLISKKMRTRQRPVHELLGTVTSAGNKTEMRWRNVMRLNELEWLRGHQFQDQVLFPAAGYVSMSVEAAMALVDNGEESVKIVELQDLKIHQAITLHAGSAGTEVVFVIRVVDRDADRVTAEYSCYSAGIDGSSADAEKVNFSGRATIMLGDLDPDALPARVAPSLPMSDVDLNRFYRDLEKPEIGLKYSGHFLVQSAKRRLGSSTVTVNRVEGNPFVVHPATLDAAFHGLFAAFCFPGDGRMWTTYLPTGIRTVRVNVANNGRSDTSQVIADCYLRSSSNKALSGDLDVFSAQDGRCEVQITGLVCSSFTKPHAKNDRKLFSRTVWTPDISGGIPPENQPPPVPEEFEQSGIIERVAFYYLRRLRDLVTLADLEAAEWHFRSLMNWAVDYVLPRVEAGRHPIIHPSWASDTPEMIAKWAKAYGHIIDLEIVVAVGENLPDMIRGTVPTLQVLMENDRLNRLYKEGLGFDRANTQLYNLISQMSHRYPRLKVLEIGAGTGGATVPALKALSPHMISYTYTDISPGFFEKAKSLFHEHASKMIFKTLDIERDPVEQGFEEHSYDLIIASNVLHATKFLLNTLTNCRRLARPGGQLVMIEITGEAIRTGFCMSGLQGWWLGKEDGRIYGPLVSEARWNELLLETGFSGVDVTCGDLEDYYCSVMATQAVNERVSLLREPLSVPEEEELRLPVSNVVVVGGKTLAVSRAVQGVKRLLRPLGVEVSVANSPEDILDDPVPAGAAVLCLADLDEPVWKEMTETKFQGIHDMILGAGYLLWVTKNRQIDQPHANMMVGMGRSIAVESPHIVMQFLDVDKFSGNASDTTMLAESLLRMVYLSRPEFSDVLWSAEHELRIQGGRVYIPRIMQNTELNDRLNADRRAITKELSPAKHAVELVQEDKKLQLREAEPLNFADPQVGRHLVKLSASSVFPINTRDANRLHLGIGTDQDSGSVVAVLSRSNSSLVRVSTDNIIQLPTTTRTDSQLVLQYLLQQLLVESLTSEVEDALWVHGADARLARLLQDKANDKQLKLVLTTTDPDATGLQVLIHHLDTERTVREIIPDRHLTFVNLDSRDNQGLDRIVRSTTAFGDNLEMRRVFKSFQSTRSLALKLSLSEVKAVIANHNTTSSTDEQIETLAVTDVSGMSLDSVGPVLTVSWSTPSPVKALLYPTSSLRLFRPDKTYFMVGLSGELGLSICAWMVANGARHIAISSRNPQIDPAVLFDLERQGAQIRVFGFDIADKDALASVHADIVATMPPISGVANAAMVLRDKAFDNCDLDDFQVVLGPKVQGSQNLDELFWDTDLDFFILFSSLSCVIGNKGQSNYGSANLFMHALANSRRRRGLAASIMDIAMLLGVGYVARTLDQYEARLFNQYSYMALNEPEFHQIFATAILSGRPDSGHQAELITGLMADRGRIARADPRFFHNIEEEQNSGGAETKVESTASVLSQLEKATGVEEILAILETAFSAKLQVILQLPAEKVDVKVPLIKLGIDSLVAVELRSWFLKELAIDMAVFKFLGGASISEICKDAAGQLSLTVAVSTGQEECETVPATGKDIPKIVEPEDHAGGSGTSDSGGSVPSSYVEVGPSDASDSASDLIHERHIDLEAFERVHEMSESQARIFFMHEYLDDKSTYNVVMGGRLQGLLKMAAFRKALDRVAKQHESLRSSFFMDEASGKPMQAVNTESQITLEQVNVNNQSEIDAHINLIKSTEFDLRQRQVMKVWVLSQSPVVHYIVFCYHHIALDGHSWILFLRDLDKAYGGRSLAAVVHQAIDMSSRRKKEAEMGNLAADLKFWSDTYSKRLETLPLFPFAKTKRRQPLLRSYDTHTLELILDAKWNRLVKKQSAAFNITPFHFYLSAMATLLHRGLSISDFSIGIMDSNRTTAEELETVGCFLNLVPARFAVTGDDTFAKLAEKTRDTVYASLAHARVPFDALVEHLKVPRSGGHSPLFQIAMNYRQGVSAKSRLGSHEVEWSTTIASRNPYDIVVDVTETPHGTQLCLTTQEYLYGEAEAQKLMSWYHRILVAAVEQPSTLTAASVPLYTPEDAVKALALGRGPRVPIPDSWQPTLSHRIDAVAAQFSESVAIVDGSGSWTYKQLLARSAIIGSALTNAGLVQGDKVAVLLHPVSDSAAVLLAAMRLGLVYVPLDTRNPSARLAAMVADCAPRALIGHDDTADEAQKVIASLPAEIAVPHLVNTSRLPNTLPATVPLSRAVASDVGFILYTSGSTGAPKGVLLTHSGYLHQLFAIAHTFHLDASLITLNQTSPGFDVALEQILLPLTLGGHVITVPFASRNDPLAIAELMLHHRVTYTIGVPSEYFSLLRYGADKLRLCKDWKIAFTCGEKETHVLRKAFDRLSLEELVLLGSYGPTEVSMSCTRGLVPTADEGMEGFLGKVLPNYDVVLVDGDKMEVVPVGVPGEICIGGAGVANGYLRREEETAKVFVKNAFGWEEDRENGWDRLYRSGDRGVMMEDGSVHFLGRIEGDGQVKINGVRIELDEIAEVVIRSSGGKILDAAISWREELKVLAAFVLPSRDGDDGIAFLEGIRDNLPLPINARPDMFISVDDLPRNINGKRDRAAIDRLPLPQVVRHDKADATFTPLELQVKHIWEDLLPTTALLEIMPDADFFHVGGTSLMLIQLQSALQSSLGGPRIPLPDLFQASTLREMAALIQNNTHTSQSQTIDWSLEVSQLLDGLPSPQSTSTTPKKTTNLTVLLTGAAGFLGHAILTALLVSPATSTIHCLAVRPHSASSLPSHPKIVTHKGDLTFPRLGLSPAEYTHLSSKADVIIHCGADVSFLKSYRSLRRANVLSTRALAEMALPRRVPLHFVSTGAVARFYQGGSLGEVSLRDSPPPAQDGEGMGYLASKWVGEVFLERVAEEHGLRVVMHRPTSVVGEKAGSHDVVGAVLKYSRVLGAVPELGGEVKIRGAFDFVKVEDVVKGIVRAALDAAETGRVGFKHHCAEQKIQPGELRGFLEEMFRTTLEEWNLTKWLEEARKAGLDPVLYEYFLSVVRDGMEIGLAGVVGGN